MTRFAEHSLNIRDLSLEVSVAAVPATVFFALQRIAGKDATDLLDWMNGVDANRSELRELVTVYSSDAKSASDAVRADLRREVAELRDEMHREFAQVRAELASGLADVRTEMRAGLTDVRTEMRTGFADARAEVASGFARQDMLRAEESARLLKWMFLFWASSTLTILGLILPRL